jgi:ferric-dicitrate binding protein FerR (iron transport regulator)
LLKLENWRNSDPNHQKFFDELAEIWQTSGDLYTDYEPDKNVVWEQMSKKLAISPDMDKPVKNRVVFYVRWAAVFMILASLVFLIRLMIPDKTDKLTLLTLDSGKIKTSVILPDSSVVSLDKNSILQYPAGFHGKYREVNLKGTAYFEVEADMQRPFIVYSHGAGVEVVGTAFYLATDTLSNIVNLIVTSGNVRFFNLQKRDSFILVHKNEKAVFDVNKGLIYKERKYNPNEIVWKTGNFIFEEERLDHICDMLSAYYDTKITLSDTVMNDWRLTAGFHQQPLRNIIKAIETNFDINADTVNNTLVLSKKP